MMRPLAAAAAMLPSLFALQQACAQDGATPTGITAIPGIEVGQFTMSGRPTGCTVVLIRDGAVGGVDVRGGAPGTRETDLLDPVNTVERVHAVVLAGGSAFGLDAASGVMRYLDEQGIGFEVGRVRVPIVAGAVLFDLGVGGDPTIRPGTDCGYQAASRASAAHVAEGNLGAGAGATVGKLAGFERAMRGGIGTASITLRGGLTVAALVAVNAAGDIVDPGTGRIVAGARTPAGDALIDARELIRSGALNRAGFGESTTIGVVATNARLTKAQASKVAQMAQDGIARATTPAHTPWDGDTIFSLATGAYTGPTNLVTVGALAAEVVADAILRAVRAARALPGLPAAGDLPPSPR